MADIEQEPGVKQGRSKGRLTFLNDRRDGDKIPVELFLGKPLSEKLSHYIGFLAKDGHVLPLSVPNWKYMRPEKIERAIREIKHVFDLPENVDDTLRGRLNTAWRKHKSAMKKEGFDPDRTKEENLANRPEDVLENQWGPLVEIWEDEKNQIIAAKNVENILQQTLKHTGGSKPHLSYAKELKDSLGRFPERLELFEVTHQKKRKNKDDEPVMEPLAAELYGRMVEFRKQASQPGSGIVLSGPNDAVSAVMGADKKGRVRCLGSTVKPKEFWGDEASSSKTAKLKTENDNLRRDLELKDKRILELETQVGTLQSILNGYLAFYGRRDELPPNSNNGGLVDLLMDMQGNFTSAMVEASNDYIVEASNDSRVDHNQQQS